VINAIHQPLFGIKLSENVSNVIHQPLLGIAKQKSANHAVKFMG